MRRPLRATAIAIVLSGLLAAVAALPAAADAPTRQPYVVDGTYPGMCSFPIQMTAASSNWTVAIRTGEDGSVKYSVTGQWKGTFTNTDTGYSLWVNNQGPISWTVYPDGSATAWVRGYELGMPGYYDITHGRLVLSYAPGWVLTWYHLSGRSEDLCAALDH